MLIDLLSTSNYVSFNIKIAKKLGLKQAIYISELMNINDKAIRKNKVDEHYFTLDRKYFYDRTTLTEDEQLDIEKGLLNIGLLEKSEGKDNTLLLNLNVLTTMMLNTDEKIDADIKKILNKKTSRRTKDEAIIDNLKKSITTTNEELRKAYCDWIDGVYARNGWMSKAAIILGEKLVDEYSNRNLDVALDIISIASVNGWKDMKYAVEMYDKNKGQKFKNVKPNKKDVGLGERF